jgi:hypothetical protein
MNKIGQFKRFNLSAFSPAFSVFFLIGNLALNVPDIGCRIAFIPEDPELFIQVFPILF